MSWRLKGLQVAHPMLTRPREMKPWGEEQSRPFAAQGGGHAVTQRGWLTTLPCTRLMVEYVTLDSSWLV